MKLILAGYEGSKRILPASSYLIKKYLPIDFDVVFLNFGEYKGSLSVGEYLSLDVEQKGGSDAWGKYIAAYLKIIPDEYVIFALDDYLHYKTVDVMSYAAVALKMKEDKAIACGRLCGSSFYRDDESDIEQIGRWFFVTLRDNAKYSATTQYCIWKKKVLTDLLERFPNPWRFEIEGSEYLNKTGDKVIGTVIPTMFYDEHSCLSSRWGGIKVPMCKREDVDFLISNGLLKREEIHE